MPTILSNKLYRAAASGPVPKLLGAHTLDELKGLGLRHWFETHPLIGVLSSDTVGAVQAVHGNDIGRWRDAGGLGTHLIAPAAKPNMVNDGSGPGGKPSIDFVAASSEYLQAASATPSRFLHEGPLTVFCVAKIATASNLPLVDTGGYDAGGRGMGLWIDDSSNTGRVTFIIRKLSGGAGNVVFAQGAATGNAFPDGEWHLASVDFTVGGSARLFADDCFVNSAAQSNAPDSGANSSQALTLCRSHTSATFSNDSVAALVAFNRVLTDRQRRNVSVYLGDRYGLQIRNLAILGDSVAAAMTDVGTRLGTDWRTTNSGTSGARIDNGATDVNDLQWLHATNGARRRRNNYIFCLAGINDCRADQAGATSVTELEVIYNSVLADPGNRLIISTLTPWSDVSFTAPREAERQVVNAGIRAFAAANANTFLLDFDVVMRDGSNYEQLRPDLTDDLLHPNTAGAALMSQLLADKVKSIDALAA